MPERSADESASRADRTAPAPPSPGLGLMTGGSGAADDVPADEIVEALRDVARLGGFFALDTAPGPASGGGLLTPEGFAARAGTVNERYGTAETRIGVSIAHLGLAARLWSPVLACALLHGIVPVMTTAEWAG